MTREVIFERINAIFRDVFDDDSIVVVDETMADHIEDWDSLMHINLVLAIESEFGVKFSLSEVIGFQNVGEVADVIEARSTK